MPSDLGPLMRRREFLRGACTTCLAVAAGGLVASLDSCASVPRMESEAVDGIVRLPASALPADGPLVIHARNLAFALAVHRSPTGTPTAFVLQCTHAGTPLTPSGDGFLCDAHGSRFAADGRVLRGPAQAPLTDLRTEERDGTIVIHVARRTS